MLKPPAGTSFGKLATFLKKGASLESRGSGAKNQELHQALALRGSRVAVYDLRETMEQARGPLPPSFLAALHVVGDETCLEPLAAAWTASAEAGWRHQVEAAFHAIVKREKISRRGALWKRLRARYPEFVGRFAQPAR